MKTHPWDRDLAQVEECTVSTSPRSCFQTVKMIWDIVACTYDIPWPYLIFKRRYSVFNGYLAQNTKRRAQVKLRPDMKQWYMAALCFLLNYVVLVIRLCSVNRFFYIPSSVYFIPAAKYQMSAVLECFIFLCAYNEFWTLPHWTFVSLRICIPEDWYTCNCDGAEMFWACPF